MFPRSAFVVSSSETIAGSIGGLLFASPFVAMVSPVSLLSDLLTFQAMCSASPHSITRSSPSRW